MFIAKELNRKDEWWCNVLFNRLFLLIHRKRVTHVKTKIERMEIVVLDGYALNPGDLSWNALKTLGNLIVHERTAYDTQSVVQAIGNAEIIFTNKTPITEAVINKVPHLKYIGVLATGFNVVDLKAASANGITVTNIPGYATETVAQFTIALLLELCHRVGDHNTLVKLGEWTASLDFCFWRYPLIALAGKTIGIIGYGKIGQATAKLCIAFGLKVLVYSKSEALKDMDTSVDFVLLDELYAKSDIISLHCPQNAETEGLISKTSIAKMKKGVLILNTSRGGIIVEQDLADALSSGKIGGAAVDVVSQEPITAKNPLLSASNCIITPHIAWASVQSRTKLMDIAVDNLSEFLNGNIINKVNE